MLKLKLQYFGHMIRTAESLKKTLMMGKIEGRKRRGQQRSRQLDGIIDSIDMSKQTEGDSEGQGSLVCCSLRGHKESDMTEQLDTNNTVCSRTKYRIQVPPEFQGGALFYFTI